jgi:hypothetical protein
MVETSTNSVRRLVSEIVLFNVMNQLISVDYKQPYYAKIYPTPLVDTNNSQCVSYINPELWARTVVGAECSGLMMNG